MSSKTPEFPVNASVSSVSLRVIRVPEIVRMWSLESLSAKKSLPVVTVSRPRAGSPSSSDAVTVRVMF